jgi:2Fe-2S ferredoxin
MAGINPYIQAPRSIERPTRKFTITYLPEGKSLNEGKTLVIDPEKPLSSGTGLPGSLLDIALASGVDIDHACGGVCACSTCHVVIEKGFSSCNPSTEEEEDQLEKAPGLGAQSRLACQCIPDGTTDLVVRVPSWNRNLVRE